jgi:hypothetical protein
MQKWENENSMLIGRSANLAVAGRGVVGGESGKMLDQKMQKEMAHMKSVTDERWRVVVYSEHGA